MKENLNIMGHPLADDDFAMLLVTSLPKSWDTFISSYFGFKVSELRVKSLELITLIIDEDCHCHDKSNSNEIANLAQTPNWGK